MGESNIEQCRTCLIKPSNMVSLLADHVVCDKVMSVLDLLKTCSAVKIEIDDGFPQFVCLNCIRSAEKSYEFRVQCEEADNSLRNQLVAYDVIEVSNDNDELECEVSEEKDGLECEEVDKYETEQLDNDITDENEEYVETLEQEETEIKCEVDVTEDIDIVESFSCTVCNLMFPTLAALTKHSSTAHDPNFFQCAFCPVRFISQHLLDKHVEKHASKKDLPETKRKNKYIKRKRTVDFICAICGKRYASLASLRLHIRKHEQKQGNIDVNSEDTFVCQECDHQFSTADDLQMHMEALHRFKTENIKQTESDEDNTAKIAPKYRCKYCFKIFKTVTSLQQHLEQHQDSRKKRTIHNPVQSKVAYKCKICTAEFQALMEIKNHLVTHNIDPKLIFNHLLYKCNECQKDFVTIYEYFGHMSTHTTGEVENTSEGVTRVVRKRPYKCSIPDCDKAFPSPSALRVHERSHESQWPKKCRYCDEMVNRWHDYMKHLNEAHDDKKTFICSQCGKKFFRERNLQSHIKTHTGERNYMCDFCGFSFHAQNNLVAHRRIHLGVKPYKCTYCPQAFSQHAGLRSHLLNHTGEKKHECPTCHKMFLRIGAMKNHIKTHTGVKDYACHICGARFGASSTRKKHLLTHTGERNHICDFCGKAFSRRSNLSVHRKIHTGETPHVCEICGKGFIQAHVLRSHMNTHRKRAEGARRANKKEPLIAEEIEIEEEEETEELTVLVEIGE